MTDGGQSARADETRRPQQPSRHLPLTPRRLEIWTTPGRAGAAAARVLYQPRNRVRIAAGAVARVLPARSHAVPSPRIQSIVEHVAGQTGIEAIAAAALSVRETGRWLYALVRADESGVVVKVGDAGDEGLAREASTLATLSARDTAFGVPELRWHGEHDGQLVIVTDIVRRRSAHAEAGIEDALVAACALATANGSFVVHGDLAPWNMVPSATGITLLDWEDSRFEHDPLYDLAHYVTRTGALLHAWRPRAAVRHLLGRESVGWRYLSEIGEDPQRAADHVMRYLRHPKTGISSPAQRRYEAAMTEAIAGWHEGSA